MVTLYNQHTSYRPKPKNLTEQDYPIFEKDLAKLIPSAHYRVLNNVYILDDNIFSISQMRFYSRYTRVYHRKQKIKTHLKRLSFFRKPTKTIEKAVWIVDTRFGINYFHWLLDSISRLIAVWDKLDSHIVLLPEDLRVIPHVSDSLNFLNIPYEYYSKKYKTKVKELLVPSFVTNPSSYYTKEYLLKMRELFLKDKKTNPSRKVYFSRQNIGHRMILNEDEIIKILESFGYEIHCPENYSLAEQMDLMTNTISLVGQHGAALTNLLFMPENGYVLELRDENWNYDNCFYSLASDLNHNYFYQIDLGDNKDRVQHANIVVDPVRFKANLELIEEQLKA